MIIKINIVNIYFDCQVNHNKFTTQYRNINANMNINIETTNPNLATIIKQTKKILTNTQT